MFGQLTEKICIPCGFLRGTVDMSFYVVQSISLVELDWFEVEEVLEVAFSIR
jgi:hypothetical protein